VQTEVQLAVLLATGFTLSLGHCSGMCGPIAAAYGVRQRDAGQVGARFARSLVCYHAGRLLAYVVIGAALAGISQIGLQISAAARGGVSVAAGLAMGFLVIATTHHVRLPGRLSNVWAEKTSCQVGRLLSATTSLRQVGLGMANGFLPCGPVATVALAAAGAAAAGAFWHAGLAMLAYGVGTIPVLIAISSGVSWASARTRVHLSRIGTVLLGLVAVQLVLRGAAALGWIAHLRAGEVVLW
jgi:sulfite exporter TauE/SafE